MNTGQIYLQDFLFLIFLGLVKGWKWGGNCIVDLELILGVHENEVIHGGS